MNLEVIGDQLGIGILLFRIDILLNENVSYFLLVKHSFLRSQPEFKR